MLNNTHTHTRACKLNDANCAYWVVLARLLRSDPTPRTTRDNRAGPHQVDATLVVAVNTSLRTPNFFILGDSNARLRLASSLAFGWRTYTEST